MQKPAVPDGAPSGARPRLPGGVKVLIGCLGLLGIGFVVAAALLGVGGFALKRGLESAAGSIDEHREAGEILTRLEREHPFSVPDDGALSDASVARFLAVTEQAWEGMRPWVEEIAAIDERRAQGTPRLRDALGGVKALGGVARSRVELARALDAEAVSLGEYVWTGTALQRALEVLEGGRPAATVPERNVALAREYAATLPDLPRDDPGPQSAFILATLWARAELPDWGRLGLDGAAPP